MAKSELELEITNIDELKDLIQTAQEDLIKLNNWKPEIEVNDNGK